MNKKKRVIGIMLAVIMSVMVLLPACGSGGSPSGIQQDVTVGKRVFVDKSGVVFFACKNLMCTALIKDGEITEFVPEGATTGTIYAMAVYGDYLYISANDGFFRYPLAIFSGGEGSPETVMKDHLEAYSHFEIFEDRIFFLKGYTLEYVPVEGGEPVVVMEDIYDFEVSDKGIYAVKTDGGMIVISPKLNDSKQIGEIAAEERMTPGGMSLYYRDNGKVKAFSVEKEETSDIGSAHDAAEYYTPWSNGKNVIYRDGSYNCYLVTPDGEKELGKNYDYPVKVTGCVYGDYLLSNDGDIKNLSVIDLATGEMKSYDLQTEMKDYLDKLSKGGGGGSDPEPQPAPKTTGEAYDIEKNFWRNTNADGDIQYLYFNDFMLTLPNADDITYEAHGDSVDIIFVPGKNAGYGGKLVTIRAYDPDDKSYESLPSYHVAGTGANTGKRFVAIYPTDLQCSTEYESVVIRYKDLKDYLFKIGEGAVNSPLQTSDSSPAP